MNLKFFGLVSITFSNLVFGNDCNVAAHDRTFSRPDGVVIADATFIKTLSASEGFDHQMAVDCDHQFQICNMYQLNIKAILFGKFESQTIKVLISESKGYENIPLNNRLFLLEKNDIDCLEYRLGAPYTVSRSSNLYNGDYCFTFEEKELGKGTYKSFMHSTYWCIAKNGLQKKL